MTENKEDANKLPKELKIFFILVISLLLIGILGFKFAKNLTFKEAAIRTFESFALISKATSGFEKALEVFLSVFGLILLWWIFWHIFDLLIEGKFSEYLKTSSFLSRMKKMKQHYIIAGGGRVGEEIASSLKKNKKDYIIIEKDENKVDRLKKKNFLVIQGDVTDSDTSDLIEAGVKNAKSIILAMPETEKNLLVTMIVKELNPDIEVYARADNPVFASKLKKAGAKVVINPEVSAAEKFLKSIE